jgi:hypothetical protein
MRQMCLLTEVWRTESRCYEHCGVRVTFWIDVAALHEQGRDLAGLNAASRI